MKERRVFEIIECSGILYDIGRQYGEACRESILKSFDMNLGAIKQTFQVSKEQIIANANKFLPYVERYDPDIIDMLKGEAEGAGISFDEAFTLKCSLELGAYYNQIMALCTSFAATGDATENGKTIIGQTIDWVPDSQMNLVKRKHADGFEQLVLDFGGVDEWSLTSSGLGLAKNVILSPPDNQRLNVPITFVTLKAMRQKSLGDALKAVCDGARGVLFHLLANDEGYIVGIESRPDEFNVLEPENDIFVHTNHYLTDRFKKGEWAYFSFPDTYLRIQRMKKLMKKNFGRLSVEVMMELMADHKNYPNSICRHIDESRPPELHFETVASFIMIPEDRVMYLAHGQPCKVEYVEYRL